MHGTTRVPGAPQGGSLQPRWHTGAYLNTRMDSHEHYVGLSDGRVVRAGTIELLPVESMWSADALMEISAFPGTTTTTLRRDNRPNLDTDVTAGPEMPDPISRDMPILPKHLTRYGYSDGCWKCRKIAQGVNTDEV